jgi:phospholipid transport system substrate-binding protein
MSHRIGTVWIMALGLLASSMQVQSQTQPVTQDVTAYELVESTTTQVMDVVGSAEDYVDEDPERYYKQVESILDPLIDYRGFARKVMGPYASSKRYRSLDDAGKQQLREQLDQFTEVMRLSLVRTYSKGLLAFGDARIEVEEPDSAQDPARTSVRQLIYVDNPEPYVVMYQMGLEKTGDWKLRNVIIENVNLGEIYRDQFLASARQFDGDLEEVIENWSTVTVEVES